MAAAKPLNPCGIVWSGLHSISICYSKYVINYSEMMRGYSQLQYFHEAIMGRRPLSQTGTAVPVHAVNLHIILMMLLAERNVRLILTGRCVTSHNAITMYQRILPTVLVDIVCDYVGSLFCVEQLVDVLETSFAGILAPSFFEHRDLLNDLAVRYNDSCRRWPDFKIVPNLSTLGMLFTLLYDASISRQYHYDEADRVFYQVHSHNQWATLLPTILRGSDRWAFTGYDELFEDVWPLEYYTVHRAPRCGTVVAGFFSPKQLYENQSLMKVFQEYYNRRAEGHGYASRSKYIYTPGGDTALWVVFGFEVTDNCGSLMPANVSVAKSYIDNAGLYGLVMRILTFEEYARKPTAAGP